MEIAENSAFSKTDVNALKAFITRTEDRYRPAYATYKVRESRRCVFIMTTNDDTYINDPTGGRRYWPVPICVTSSSINHALLRELRPQLMAEAIQRYRAGERWHAERDFEEAHLKPLQADRQEDLLWCDEIKEHVAGKSVVYVGEIQAKLLMLTLGERKRKVEMDISRVLKSLGWVRDKDNQGKRCYCSPEHWELRQMEKQTRKRT